MCSWWPFAWAGLTLAGLFVMAAMWSSLWKKLFKDYDCDWTQTHLHGLPLSGLGQSAAAANSKARVAMGAMKKCEEKEHLCATIFSVQSSIKWRPAQLAIFSPLLGNSLCFSQTTGNLLVLFFFLDALGHLFLFSSLLFHYGSQLMSIVCFNRPLSLLLSICDGILLGDDDDALLSIVLVSVF